MFEELSVLLEMVELKHYSREGSHGDALEGVKEESQHHLIPRLLLKLCKAGVGSLQRPLVLLENAGDTPEGLEAAVIMLEAVIGVSLGLVTTFLIILLLLLLWLLEPTMSITEREGGTLCYLVMLTSCSCHCGSSDTARGRTQQTMQWISRSCQALALKLGETLVNVRTSRVTQNWINTGTKKRPGKLMKLIT